MTVEEIEKLASSFADAVKEVTPQAIDLAQQMYLLNAMQNFLISFPIMIGLWIAYKLFLKCNDDGREIPISIAGILLSIALFVSVAGFIENATNAMFPEAALLGRLLK